MVRKILFLSCALFLLAGCSTPRATASADWREWQARRLESVAGTNGWTTLIGLHWLRDGDSSVGLGATNDVVVRSDRVPLTIGIFSRKGTNVSFSAAQDVDVRVSGERVQKLAMITDASKNPTRLEIGAISIVVIERGERIGLRIRDMESSTRRNFQGLRYFPYDPKWRVEGRFRAFQQTRKVHVPDVTGSFQDFPSPGEIVFPAHGADRTLAVALEPETPDFFVMFHDETARKATYPAGRFLYVGKPENGDRVVIDFNRAYTPPCGFTEFATCPLPPRENWLPFEIEAGELAPITLHPVHMQ